ncbi:MAG: hypothetical protein C0P75_008930 [Bacilli bacterium]|uniref:Conjugal transfer protein n=1 Tax=Ureibacillus suwonensis TaxID=313007 RepID=A0ABW0RE29_9BACL|nr:hypothetical protein [Bacilli bacterium]
MKVIFYNVPNSKIKNFELMSFAEAVKLSHKIEHECRKEKEQFTSEFQVLGDNNKVYYRGTFEFGSYEFPNIYHKIKNMANRIKVDKQFQADKLYLLDQIEKLTPEKYKKEEKVDKFLAKVDKSQISKLKGWQRKSVYAIAVLGLTGSLVTGFTYVVQKDNYEKALADSGEELKQSQELIAIYESALMGDKNEMFAKLEQLDKKKLTDNQVQILFLEYINNNKFQKAVELFDGDHIQAETMIMSSTLPKKTKREKIAAFNEIYPTNEARYDLAYLDGDWKLMLNIQNVRMNVKRSEMKTYALLKLGKIDEAKLELNNNNSDELSKKITKYEVITAEIKTLEEKYKVMVNERKINEANQLAKQITDKRKELQSL